MMVIHSGQPSFLLLLPSCAGQRELQSRVYYSVLVVLIESIMNILKKKRGVKMTRGCAVMNLNRRKRAAKQLKV